MQKQLGAGLAREGLGQGTASLSKRVAEAFSRARSVLGYLMSEQTVKLQRHL